jgi:4-amino-4-deoxy-L-arabinose transferase-like glycosyltransferase
MLSQTKIFLVLLLLLLSFHLVGNILWISKNNSPPAWDQAYHTTRSLQIYNFFKNPSNSRFSSKFIESLSDPYAPLVKVFSGLTLFFFSGNTPSIKLTQFTGTIFFLLTILLIFFLAKEIFKNNLTAILAAFVFSFFQIIYDNSRWLLLDIPLTFFVLLTIFFLIKSDNLKNRSYLLLSFLTLSFAFLTKAQSLVYLFFPYVWFFAKSQKNNEVIKNFFLGILIFLIIAVPWLLLSYKNLLFYLKFSTLAEPLADPTNLLKSTTWFYYLSLTINHVITFFVLLFLLPSFYFFFKTKSNYKKFLIGYLFFYYIVFTIVPNKDLRYIFPLFPFVSIIAARGLAEVFSINRTIFGGLFIPIFLWDLFFYFVLSFGIILPLGIHKGITIPYFGDLVYFKTTSYPVKPVEIQVWPNEQLILDLKYLFGNNNISVVIIPNLEKFNDNNLNMFAVRNGFYDFHTIRSGGRNQFKDTNELDNFIDQYYYFLYTDGDIGPFYQFDRVAFEQMQKRVKLLWDDGEFQALKTYQLPIGQTFVLLQRKGFSTLF